MGTYREMLRVIKVVLDKENFASNLTKIPKQEMEFEGFLLQGLRWRSRDKD
jgi:hypothetical protein